MMPRVREPAADPSSVVAVAPFLQEVPQKDEGDMLGFDNDAQGAYFATGWMHWKHLKRKKYSAPNPTRIYGRSERANNPGHAPLSSDVDRIPPFFEIQIQTAKEMCRPDFPPLTVMGRVGAYRSHQQPALPRLFHGEDYFIPRASRLEGELGHDCG
jgi:hypothetical protein